MKKDNFLVLSLDDSNAKKIANVVNNGTCRKILNFLIEKDSTESEIASELELPISTVHYNLKQLLDSKLVDWENYHYSSKGKEVKHYSLTNKYIIIAPREKRDFLHDKLKAIIPMFFILLGTIFVNLFTKTSQTSQNLHEVQEDMIMARNMVETSSLEVAQTSSNKFIDFFTNLITIEALWFLIGSLFIFVVIIIFQKVKIKLKK